MVRWDFSAQRDHLPKLGALIAVRLEAEFDKISKSFWICRRMTNKLIRGNPAWGHRFPFQILELRGRSGSAGWILWFLKSPLAIPRRVDFQAVSKRHCALNMRLWGLHFFPIEQPFSRHLLCTIKKSKKSSLLRRISRSSWIGKWPEGGLRRS